MPGQPVDSVIPRLLKTLSDHNRAILQAPPGAGKTTRVPPALLSTPFCKDSKILLLEPRRLAARNAARFMAAQRSERVGETVGYRTRLDTRIGPDTRIEVVTEGILTRLIQADPALEDYAAVIFDEFHERSLQADLGLALVLESQQALREDLRLLIMSATLDTDRISTLLDQAPVVHSEGRSFPVTVHYRPPERDEPLISSVTRAVHHALASESGSLLVFLPGEGEIRRTVEALEGNLPADVQLAPLYGQLSPEAQDAAIQPASTGQRKLVLATAIAESSLTIEGIRVVIDAGLARRSVFDPGSGMSRLQTSRVSRSSAEQRRGRAGRIGPGVCYRLWSESAQAGLAPFAPAEILEADLAPLALELTQWGCREPKTLAWLDPPPRAPWRQAMDLLQWLDAVDDDGAITPHGRDMQRLGLHPRLAHMVLQGRAMGLGRLAAELAALLEERDPLPNDEGADMEKRVLALRGEYPAATSGRLRRIRQAVNKWLPGNEPPAQDDEQETGRLLAQAYPDRIARRRGESHRFLLANGRGATLSVQDPLARKTWLVAAALDGREGDARIFLAAPVSGSALEQDLAGRIKTRDRVTWDERAGTMVTQRERRLGAIRLSTERLPDPPAEMIENALLDVVRERGLGVLPWCGESRRLRARLQFLHRLWPEQWPPCDDENLLATLDEWLAPFLVGRRSLADLGKLPLKHALMARLSGNQSGELERLAPPRLQVPSGQSMPLDYDADPGPVLAVKLQAVFGLSESPRVADGRCPVVFHLLSPAGRPLAVTADLASFWRQAYPEVRKDMRGRYPKHPWPDDPLAAEATMATKRR
ncbi:ATP-dependent helicase HrpB [Gammaproteobacteria bacterium AB-CW1]|uniref:ATP-dependent helicase HrpB n=1 Tax=Natronospira elongata TaxID=3110268 RepID=A0AAP6JG30_9GAMM|nr:ATP-dependent helicase HrpB [Gammaproteobacteria bacterium AB-CW1]